MCTGRSGAAPSVNMHAELRQVCDDATAMSVCMKCNMFSM